MINNLSTRLNKAFLKEKSERGFKKNKNQKWNNLL